MDQPIQAELCTMGVPRDPWDFLQRAVEVGHPRSMAIHLSQFLLVKQRAAFLVKWTSRCKEQEAEETKLHQSLEPYLQEVLAGKRLLVFQEMLDDVGYPDRNLVRDICNGFRLTGWLEKSNVFPAALKRPMHNVESEKKTAKGISHSIIKQVGAAGDPDLEAEVWRQTNEEVEKGWTWFDETCEPLDKLLAKRFGLQQGEKVWLIDDCTMGGFNGACGSTERLRIHAVDEMAAYMAWCLSNLPPDALREVVWKTCDLKNAY